MDKALKQRMVGAVVLIALGVIFIPMLLDTSSEEEGTRSVELDIPAAPDRDYRSRLLPLDERDARPTGESVGQVARESESAGSEPSESEPSPRAEAEASESATTGNVTEETPSGEAADGDEAEPDPVEAESRPAEEPASQPLGNWFVQVGSFSQEANATDLRDQLRNAGYTAFVETSTVEGQTKHRVKVGPEMERSSAERQRDRIQTEFDLKGIVVSEP